MTIKSFNNLDDMKKHFGFSMSGDLFEKDLFVCETDCDLNDRRFHDAEVLATISKNLGGNSLEIGTSDGHGTYKIATNTNGVVFTLNALPEQISGNFVTHAIKKEGIGSYLRKMGIQNFVQYYADSLSWVIPPEIHDLSLVFIDGCHDTKYVYSDSKNTINRLKSGGFMIWHDFNPGLRGRFNWIDACMTGALKFCEESGIEEVYHLKDSWIGFWKKL